MTEASVTVFTESGGFRVTRHQHPAWKIVLPTARALLGRTPASLERRVRADVAG
ncbi:hypothetical protein J3R03_003830 [Actinoplanes couchii]|nr:hypothetical protein [Actinoplanes couchii]